MSIGRRLTVKKRGNGMKREKKRGLASSQYFRDVSLADGVRRGGGPAQLSSATAIFP